MSFDRWGDSTHKMTAFNIRHQPSFKDQNAIDRMDAENMVMYPYQEPHPVTKHTLGTVPDYPRRYNKWAETLRNPEPRFLEFNPRKDHRNDDIIGSPYKRTMAPGPQGKFRKRKNRNKSTWKSHRDTQYEPPSPQYRPYSSDEEEEQEIVDHACPQEDEHSSYETPPEILPPDQGGYTDMPSQEHKNMQEEVDDMNHYLEMNNSKRQGGGDIEPISPPGITTSPRPKINTALEAWHLEPNKVRFLDGFDTQRANVGRHIPKAPKLMRAKTVPHLVFVNPPASPDGVEKSSDSRKEKANSCPPMDIQKTTPDSTTINPKQPPIKEPKALPIPLEPQVVNVPPHGIKTSEKDSDCLIVEDPSVVHYKPKKGWAKRKMEQTKKTLILHLPKCDAHPYIKKEVGAAQEEIAPMEKAEGDDPGAGEIEDPTHEDSGNGSIEELD